MHINAQFAGGKTIGLNTGRFISDFFDRCRKFSSLGKQCANGAALYSFSIAPEELRCCLSEQEDCADKSSFSKRELTQLRKCHLRSEVARGISRCVLEYSRGRVRQTRSICFCYFCFFVARVHAQSCQVALCLHG